VKKEVREQPELNIERSPLILIISVILALLLIFSTYRLFVDVNPWGFLIMIPALFYGYHTLWILLNPFAMVFRDRVEMKQSLFTNKQYFFNDIKRIQESSGRIYVVFKDDDSEPLRLFGIQPAARAVLKKAFFEKVTGKS
jgi:hypothetical protein